MVDDSMPSIFFKVGYITSDIQLRSNNLIPLPSALLPRLDIYIQEKIIAHSKAVLAIFNVVISTIEPFKSNINDKIIVASALTNSCGFHFL